MYIYIYTLLLLLLSLYHKIVIIYCSTPWKKIKTQVSSPIPKERSIDPVPHLFLVGATFVESRSRQPLQPLQSAARQGPLDTLRHREVVLRWLARRQGCDAGDRWWHAPLYLKMVVYHGISVYPHKITMLPGKIMYVNDECFKWTEGTLNDSTYLRRPLWLVVLGCFLNLFRVWVCLKMRVHTPKFDGLSYHSTDWFWWKLYRLYNPPVVGFEESALHF